MNSTPGYEFEAVYRMYASLVRGFLYRYAGNQDLDDLVQETFVKVHQHLISFEGRSSLKTWIFTIALNTAREHIRRQKRRQWVTYVLQPPDVPQQVTAADEQSIAREQVRQALAKLNPKLRDVVLLACQEEMELEEVAEVLAIPVGTVKSRLHQARQKLQGWKEKEN